MPPAPGIAYRCFVDAASGVPGADSYAVTIAYKLSDRVVADAIREVRPPFNAFEVINTVLAPLCKLCGVHTVRGDNYAGELAREPVRRAGISYELAPRHKSELYVDPFLPTLNAGKIDLPRNDRAINQICSFERSVQRSGRDQITHLTHGHDDIANAIAGAVDYANNFTLFNLQLSQWPPPANDTDEARKAADQKQSEAWYRTRLQNYLRMHGAFGWP